MRKVNVEATYRTTAEGVSVEFTRDTIGEIRFNFGPYVGSTKGEAVKKMIDSLQNEGLTGSIKLTPHVFHVSVVNNNCHGMRYQRGEGVTVEEAIADAIRIGNFYGKNARYDAVQGFVLMDGGNGM